MGEAPALPELVALGDAGPLLDEVERACARRDWDHLLLVRERCLRATEEAGKQLWPVAQFAEYRLAREAPGPIACRVVQPGAARFALGPLTEVVAAHHTWAQLADHIDLPFIAATVAQERVLRGEDLRGDVRTHAEELELPLVLADWEPDPPLPTYRSHDRQDASPAPPDRPWEQVGDAPEPAPSDWADAEAAAHDVLGHWQSASSGHVAVRAFAGSVDSGVRAMAGDASGADTEVVPLYLDEALARLYWASATGAAQGRRRGLAAARSATWWFLHRLAGLAWPADPDGLGEALEGLGWYAFRSGASAPGWSLQLAIETAERTLVIDATDRV